jgi:microcystin-dependent protein
MFCGNFAPTGWFLCNGQTLPISSYNALFAIIGTTFGGNGTTTFQLPNMQGRVPMHWGTGAGLSTYVIGEQAGTENVTLLYNNMPLHNHPVNAVNAGGQTLPTNNFPGAVSNSATEKLYSTGPATVTMAASMIANAGGNQSHPNLQPFLCVTFIMCFNGIFPSRN